MSLFHPKTFRMSLWPAMMLIFISAMSNLKVKRYRWRVLNGLISTVCTLIVHWYYQYDRFSDLPYFTLWMGYCETAVIIVAIWSWELRGADVVKEVMVEITKFDQELEHFGLKLNHEKFMWRQLIQITKFLTFVLCLLALSSVITARGVVPLKSYNVNWHLTITILRHLQRLQPLITELVLEMVLDALSIRFENINKIFERIGKSDKKVPRMLFTTCMNSRFYKHPSSHIVMDKVNRACRIHRKLSKITGNIGHAFSLYFLVYLVNTFILIIQQGARFIWLSQFRKQSTLERILSCAWFTFNIFKLWQNLWSCSRVSKEANKIGSLLFLVPIDDHAVHRQLQELSVYFMQESVRFSAGGTCSIDQILASSAFYSIAKYLIILHQMKSD